MGKRISKFKVEKIIVRLNERKKILKEFIVKSEEEEDQLLVMYYSGAVDVITTAIDMIDTYLCGNGMN